jgi:hypothetical protein
MRKHIAIAVGIVSTLLVSACGGGGSPSPASTTGSTSGGTSAGASTNGSTTPNSPNGTNNSSGNATSTPQTANTGSNGLPLTFFAASLDTDTGIFTAVDSKGFRATSIDGENWTTPVAPTGFVTGIASNVSKVNGKYFAGVQPLGLLVSADGTAWANTTGGLLNPSGVAFGNNIYVSVGINKTGNTTIAWSNNANSWTQVSGQVANITWNGIVFANNQFVIVGEKDRSATSPDGKNWTLSTKSTPAELQGVSYASFATPPRYVAVGNGGTIVDSTDGATWADARTAPDSTATGANILKINCSSSDCFAGAGFVSGGGKFSFGRTTNVRNWNWAVYGKSISDDPLQPPRLQFAKYGAQIGSKFVVIGDSGTVFTSNDGTAWNEVPAK